MSDFIASHNLHCRLIPELHVRGLWIIDVHVFMSTSVHVFVSTSVHAKAYMRHAYMIQPCRSKCLSDGRAPCNLVHSCLVTSVKALLSHFHHAFDFLSTYHLVIYGGDMER